MSEHLSDALREALASGRAPAGRTVRVGSRSFPILRFWDRGFALDPNAAPGLRGLVDVYDGDRHVFQALVYPAREEGGERVFEFKYATPALDTAPTADFVRGGPPVSAEEA